jgi:aryl-alcohol dehydrogenase-like predicted oxidoreductase
MNFGAPAGTPGCDQDEAGRIIGASPASVAMAWVARQPGVTAVIAGPRTLSHLHDSLAAFSLTLPPDALARLSDISRPASPEQPDRSTG